jgi:hypothetical protein
MAQAGSGWRIFADLELARRLERPEAVAGARFVEARRRVSPGTGAQWIEAGGVYATFDGPASPVTQTFGLGLFSDATAAGLEFLEAFFQERGTPVRHEVSPLAGLPVADLLSRRGSRPIEFTNVLYRALSPGDSPVPPDSRLRARLMVPGEEEFWAQTSARGWAGQPEFTESLLGFSRVSVWVDGVFAYFVEIDGEPVATGVLHCHEGVALFGGASTVPEA